MSLPILSYFKEVAKETEVSEADLLKEYTLKNKGASNPLLFRRLIESAVNQGVLLKLPHGSFSFNHTHFADIFYPGPEVLGK